MIVDRPTLLDILGCSERALTKWTRDGMPTLANGGRGRGDGAEYDTVAVLRWLQDRAIARASRESPDAELKRLQVRTLEFELARKTGLLVPADEVAALWAGAIIAARTELLALTNHITSALAARYGVDVDRQLIEAEIRQALDKLAEHPPANAEASAVSEETDQDLEEVGE